MFLDAVKEPTGEHRRRRERKPAARPLPPGTWERYSSDTPKEIKPHRRFSSSPEIIGFPAGIAERAGTGRRSCPGISYTKTDKANLEQYISDFTRLKYYLLDFSLWLCAAWYGRIIRNKKAPGESE